MTNTQKTPPRPRVARPEPAPGTFAATIRDTMARLNLDEPRAADYFGVPVFTLRKWASGERQPGAAVGRLLDVLGFIEAMAPALHEALVPKSTVNPDKERVSRKRKPSPAPKSVASSDKERVTQL